MKKSLKLVGIFMIVMIVGTVGGISLYFLIANNKTYYIYDVRIVNPISEAPYYVYTDSEAEYTSMRNQVRYLKNSDTNNFEIAVYAYTSTNTTQVSVTSSDTSVASVRPVNGHLMVTYFGAGETDITATIGGVSDTVKLTVYDVPAEDFVVFDDDYYGENYSKFFGNEIVVYADENEYRYGFKTSNILGGEFKDFVNNEHLEIDYSTVNTDAFPNKSDVRIDPTTNELVLKCAKRNDLPENDIITINSYSYADDGSYRGVESFAVKVSIVTYVPQYLQIMLSKSPDFDEGSVFMDTEVVDISSYSDDDIWANKDILNNFLNYQRAEISLGARESAVYDVFFSEKIKKIYLKVRKVYTNGDVVYLNDLTSKENPYQIKFNGADSDTHIRLSSDKTYYILSLDSAYFNSGESFEIYVGLKDFDLEHTFSFGFSDLNATEENEIEKFYSYDEATGSYTFTYWDERMRFDDEIYDRLGRIVGFGGK